MSREGGDWMCAACNHSNFKRRDVCQKCSCPKYASAAEITSYALNLSRTEVLAGDWYCNAMNCGAHNYASRISCYRCGAGKPDYFGYNSGMVPGGYAYDASTLPGYKTGDWMCSRCGGHNFANKRDCYKCMTPKEHGGGF